MNQFEKTNCYKESGAKKFWRVVLGSMLGFILSSIVLSILSFIFFVGILVGLSGEETTMVKDNSVLKLKLEGTMMERAEKNPFEGTSFAQYSSQIGLRETIQSLKNAANDDKIKGVTIEFSAFSSDFASLKELRDAIAKFKESGKFVYAYADNYSQGAYYLASVADKVFVNRLGGVDLKGLAFQVTFYKGLIDKLGVDVQVIRHGQFKSAVEPYMLDKMSEANREQMTVLCNTLWGTMLSQISESRHISINSLQEIADNLTAAISLDALNCGIVDGVCQYAEYEVELKKILGIELSEKVNYAPIKKYNSVTPATPKKDNIAVIYAVGSIVDGKGDETTIGSTTLCNDIRKAYENEEVKAIVLRVNSPGGSAMASEAIWNEIENAKKAGKKVVTSMSGYAASGGYYISCNSDKIIAQPNTLTGSIGVFGIVPSFQRMLESKLGITVDVVKSNEHADMSSGRLMDEMERAKVQASVEDIYALFMQRVAQGRNLSVEHVDSVGQGRVWAGADAISLGLVDELGSLEDAIAAAAELAGVSDYGIINYPIQKDWLTQMLETDTEVKMDKALRQELGELYYTYKSLKTVTEAKGVQAKLPFDIVIN
mgnify:CR=1 FL=1